MARRDEFTSPKGDEKGSRMDDYYLSSGRNQNVKELHRTSESGKIFESRAPQKHKSYGVGSTAGAKWRHPKSF